MAVAEGACADLFGNAEGGYEASGSTKFEWHAPSTVFRYTLHEFTGMLAAAGFGSQFLHSEGACHSRRFHK